MALFGRRNTTPPKPPTRPRFGAGRRLTTTQQPELCIATLAQVRQEIAPAKYQHMPSLYPAAIAWYGEEPLPSEARSCSYGTDDFFVFLFWPRQGGTTIGLFPLGGSEESLRAPLIGLWKQADASLTSVGRFEPHQLSLLAPRLGERYYTDILEVAGVAPTDHNIAVLARQVAELFKIKAHEFMSRQDPRAASRFLADRPWTGDIELAQRVLKDLGNWNYQVLPYIQYLPWRVRGIILEPGDDGRPAAPMWEDMH